MTGYADRRFVAGFSHEYHRERATEPTSPRQDERLGIGLRERDVPIIIAEDPRVVGWVCDSDFSALFSPSLEFALRTHGRSEILEEEFRLDGDVLSDGIPRRVFDDLE